MYGRNNYISVPKMYTLGPLPQSDTIRRMNQGLQAQLLSNNCAGCNIINPDNNCVTCRLGMYPAQQVHWNYGMPQIPKNCPCLVYLQAP
jgi:hypothetical protein